MNKIMMALDPGKWNRDTVDIACYLAKISRSKVNGIFLKPDEGIENVLPSANPSEDDATTGVSMGATFITRLKDACISRETSYTIRDNRLSSVAKIIEETMFADILIIDPAITLNENVAVPPSSLAKHILHHAHCPVILGQGPFRDMSEIIFTYNGSEESSHAMKQFSYLFPELANSRITVLEIDNKGTDHIAEKIKLMEWMNVHYHHTAYVTLKGNPSGSLSGYLLAHPKALVVMGAYGRSFLSRLLKPSTANPVAVTVNNPIFIAHQ